MPKRKQGERRWDQYGEFRLVHVAEGYAMVRRVGLSMLLMPMSDWLRLGTTPEGGKHCRWWDGGLRSELRIVKTDAQ